MEPVTVGLIGCGTISETYLSGAARSEVVDIVAVADIDPAAAEAKAQRHAVEARTVAALLGDPAIAIALNLTIPAAHAAVSRAALDAGKHVYSEKPLAVRFREAEGLVAAAERAGLRIGVAPDTFLGAGHQAVRRLVDDGAIGTVTGGAVMFASSGPERWHPSPAFFYAEGAGPLLDIACYPITQLVNCLGPVASAMAHATRSAEPRTVGTGPLAGTPLSVAVDTTLNGVLQFEAGANVSLTVSWDVWAHARPPLELYGTEGTILNPDPNFFGGPAKVSQRATPWRDVSGEDLPFGAPNRTLRDGREVADHRIIGLIDMAAAIAQGRQHRANAQLALHVSEVMEALQRAADEGRRQSLTTRCERPLPVPLGKDEDVFLAAG